VTELAFAGAGTITVAHGLAVEALADVDVTLVTSRTPTTASERAAQLHATAGTYADLPGSAGVVVVATPPATHAAFALDAVGLGRAVIVEKPLCATLEEADRLVAAEESGARIGYAENLAFAPIVEQTLRAIARLGPLRHLSARALQPRPTWGGFLHADWGGGVLFDLGVHPLALVLLAAGDDPPVWARGVLSSAPDIEVDDLADVRVGFASGLEVQITTSWRHETAEWDLQAAGATGAVRLELLPTMQLEVDGEPAPWPPPPPGATVPQVHEFGYVEQLRSFLSSFAAGIRVTIGAAFGRKVLDVVSAAYASAAADGAMVAVPFDGPRHRTPLQLWLEP
jgi:predicted dehydrogenase